MYAIVDLETTGGRPETDRIIEIAVYVHDGQAIVDSYSSLVNPGVTIPPFIARLTGISDEMVQSAPTFSEIKEKVFDVLGEHIFVAHNAPFDHSFLMAQFGNEGIQMTNKVMCTCTTARKVIPGYPSYSLGKLCRSLGIPLENAHRAAADALATTRLLELLISNSRNNLLPFVRDPSRPNPHCNIPASDIQALPDRAGILFFTDAEDQVIFIAKAWNIRKKAQTLVAKFGYDKMTSLGVHATGVKSEVTGSRIAASIREHELLKEYNPAFNRKFKYGDSRMAIFDFPDSNQLFLKVLPTTGDQQPLVTCTSKTAAFKLLKKAMQEFQLDASTIGLADKPSTLDFETENKKTEQAIAWLQSQRRSYFITDQGPDQGTKWVFLVEDSRFRGYRLFEHHDPLSVEFLMESVLDLEADHPAIIRSLSRHIAKREYLSIEPLTVDV